MIAALVVITMIGFVVLTSIGVIEFMFNREYSFWVNVTISIVYLTLTTLIVGFVLGGYMEHSVIFNFN